jgi:hypothetical protein
MSEEISRIEKMNRIRLACGYDEHRKPFFYREEFLAIIESIIGRDLKQAEERLSVNALVKAFIPGWSKQTTAVNHPSVANIDHILELIDCEEVSEEEVSEEEVSEEEVSSEEVSSEEVSEDVFSDCCIAENTPKSSMIALTDFIIQGLNESFSHNILSVSVCANDPKQFTITLK